MAEAGTSPADVLVVGGSIIGLTASIALARSGHRVTLLEAGPRIQRSVGAVRVCDDALRNALRGIDDEASGISNMDGDGATTETEERATLWTDVYEHLVSQADDEQGLTEHYGARAIDLGQDADCVWVSTASGETFSASILFGADGRHGTVRRTVSPEHPDVSYVGYGAWFGTTEKSDICVASSYPAGIEIIDRPNHALIGYPVAAARRQTGSSEQFLGWEWYTKANEELFPESYHSTDSRLNDRVQLTAGIGTQSELLALEARLQWPAVWQAAIIDAIEAQNCWGVPVVEYLPERIVSGRIALIGDAAHATTPLSGRGLNCRDEA